MLKSLINCWWDVKEAIKADNSAHQVLGRWYALFGSGMGGGGGGGGGGAVMSEMVSIGKRERKLKKKNTWEGNK